MRSDTMQLIVNTAGINTVVAVHANRLDASIAPQFKAEMMAILNQGAKHLVLDLGAVKLIDSSGLGTLVSVLKALNGEGGIVIRGASPSVLGLFKLTRMDRVFTIEPAAVAA
jgi:anti-sigma B factor antagonist